MKSLPKTFKEQVSIYTFTIVSSGAKFYTTGDLPKDSNLRKSLLGLLTHSRDGLRVMDTNTDLTAVVRSDGKTTIIAGYVSGAPIAKSLHRSLSRLLSRVTQGSVDMTHVDQFVLDEGDILGGVKNTVEPKNEMDHGDMVSSSWIPHNEETTVTG